MRIWGAVFCLVLTVACVRNETNPPPAVPPASSQNPPQRIDPLPAEEEPGPFAGRLRVMEYNVENLFDNEHDIVDGIEKADWEFLPKDYPGKQEFCAKEPEQFRKKCFAADWTADKLEVKLGQIARVVAKAGGVAPAEIPDMMALIEVENAGVVRRLADKLGYRSLAITESPDARGIDVALIFNESAHLKFLRSAAARVDLARVNGRPARDVLMVEFEYGAAKKRKLVVFVNHWPSQGNNPINRRLFAEKVRELAGDYQARGFDVLVTGDFNVDYLNDYPSPMHLLEEKDGKPWLTDVDREARRNPEKLGRDLSTFAPGTYFYFSGGYPDSPAIMTWNLLDRFLVSAGLMKRVDLASYRILNDPELTTTVELRAGPQKGTKITGIPRRYSHLAATAETAGFSDHFAITLDIQFE